MNNTYYLNELNKLRNKQNKTKQDLQIMRAIERLLYHRERLDKEGTLVTRNINTH